MASTVFLRKIHHLESDSTLKVGGKEQDQFAAFTPPRTVYTVWPADTDLLDISQAVHGSKSQAGEFQVARQTMGAAPSRQEASSGSSRSGDGGAVPVVPSSASSGTGSNQAQSKRPPAPHMFHEIVAQEKTAASPAELEDQAYSTGIYLAGKSKKYWVHEKTRCNCFMIFPRGLSITWSDDPRFWSWHPLKETSDTEIEAVSLQNVCWLEIHGKLELSHLTPGVNYDVVFEVMLNEPVYGWSVPVNLRLKFPDRTVQERKEKLQEKPRNQWLELKAGEVKAQQGQKGEMEISMFEYEGGEWKRGLLIKGIKIIPKE